MESTEKNEVCCQETKATEKAGGFKATEAIRYGNIVIWAFLGLYFFLIPAVLMIYYLCDAGLAGGKVPKIAFRVHRLLSPKYEKWAKERVKSGNAKQLDIENISGTEWPLFGSVFYLMATESLEEAWEKDKSYSSVSPKEYARGAIEAATELVTDPGHAAWVKQHWGEDYLDEENIFYRMLLINAMSSYENLVGGGKYIPMLRNQVETLAKEVNESPYGWVDDYPGQCFPTDVEAGIAAIRKADAILGTDHSEFVKRAIRAFRGERLDLRGLVPYDADSKSGVPGEGRGCSTQWLTVWAAGLWPEESKLWYDDFEKYFWQERWCAAGFREFTRESSNSEWYVDVDSGPVIAGFGASASAFGIGAARANGRFDHAYPLSAELIVMTWPLANGTLLLPRFLSNMSDAPYLGEAAILFVLTRMPAAGITAKTGGQMPVCVYVMLAVYLTAFAITAVIAVRILKKRCKADLYKPVISGRIQLVIWFALAITAIVFGLSNQYQFGLIAALAATLLPRKRSIAGPLDGKLFE